MTGILLPPRPPAVVPSCRIPRRNAAQASHLNRAPGLGRRATDLREGLRGAP